MVIRGWIYVLVNPALEGLVKIGFSTKDPALRIRELSTTGVPQNFELAFDALVENPRQIEQIAHSRLKDVHENKEFFRVLPAVAVQTIREIAAELKLELHLQRVSPSVKPAQTYQSHPPLIPTGTVRRLTPSSMNPKEECATTQRRKARREEFKTSPSACPQCGSLIRPPPSGYCSACFGEYR